MDMVYRSHKMELERAQTDMEDCEKNIATCKLKSGDLEERYRFFQEMRGYVRDLVECLNEKVGLHIVWEGFFQCCQGGMFSFVVMKTLE